MKAIKINPLTYFAKVYLVYNVIIYNHDNIEYYLVHIDQFKTVV